MRAVPALVFLGLLSIGAAEDATAVNLLDQVNTINPKPSVRLDPYIRKALLKALNEFEESTKFTTDSITDETTDESRSGGTNTYADISETLPTETSTDEMKDIQIHSFIVNGQSAFANLSSNVEPTIIEDKISILSTTAGNVENQVTATLPTQTPYSEIFQTSQSGINIHQVRNVASGSYIDSNLLTSGDTTTNLPTTVTTLDPTTTTTTSTTTTTTTPKPTHNEDGENIEDVSKKDVQVFQAPLVAAFTVHQDAQGLPKKVVPIYQQLNAKETVKSLPIIPVANDLLPPTSIPINSVQPDIISQQYALQQQLQEKQRILEDQLRYLQQQQRQQEELLRKQYFLLQQKEIQRQQQYQQFEQFSNLKRQQSFDQQRPPINQATHNFQFQNQQKNQFQQQNGAHTQNAQVSIQQSVALPIPTPAGLANQQQLPNREAVDFLITLRSQQPEQFPLQENHLPQGITNFLHPGQSPLQNSFQHLQNSNQLRPLEESFRQQNRVFRQESRGTTGNLGFNNNYQRFNTYQPIQSNRFFGFRQNQFNPNSELQQLLFQTGLNGRNHEDLNIVTKVLSLNHGVQLNNNVSNRLPFDNRANLGRNSK